MRVCIGLKYSIVSIGFYLDFNVRLVHESSNEGKITVKFYSLSFIWSILDSDYVENTDKNDDSDYETKRKRKVWIKFEIFK